MTRALVTLVVLSAVASRQYGISLPRQLAFVLEAYNKTVQGKLLTVVLTLLLVTPNNALHLSSHAVHIDG
ncbi:hypothetical protein PINS_up023458 [Pythium insidiosum]|nr:hypothetical protein PINS_up023458 [Pythium insidiosum]